MKISKSLAVGLSVNVCFSSIALSAEISTNSALMQAMDKITGRVNKITVPVNSKISYGDFSLVLRACKKRPAEETPENFAFVDVADKSFGEEEYNIFRGWMLSSAPGINAIEHPIYDVWLLECVDSDVSNAKILSSEELDRRDNFPTKDAIKEVKVDDRKKEVGEEKIKKAIHIKEFINEDRDIEKEINNTSSYEDEISSKELLDEDKPQNLLNFAKQPAEEIEENANNDGDELSKAIDEEIKQLNQN
jgi:hypothetical protein